MLYIEVPPGEFWDELNQCFIDFPGQKLQLEHSLVSISKWESKWKKPFLSETPKTEEETRDYIRCMTLTQNVKPETYFCLSGRNIDLINKYIDDPMTATTFSNLNEKHHKKEVITSEVIYYWMIANNVPMECQKWHLNRLLTLIQVCSLKSQPPKKMSKAATAKQYSALNAARRKKFNTRG